MKGFIKVGIIVGLFLMISIGANAQSVKGHIRISDESVDIQERVELDVDAGASEAIFDELETGTVTGIDALVEAVYFNLFDKDMDPSSITEQEKNSVLEKMGKTTQSAGWISELYGLDKGSNFSWLFSNKNSTPMDTISSHVLQDGFDLWIYYCDWSVSFRGSFEGVPDTVDEGDNFTVVLKAISINDEMWGTVNNNPIKGKVLIDGKTFACNDNGEAVISGIGPGVYKIKAEWENSLGFKLLSPIATIEITGDTDSISFTEAYEDMVAVYKALELKNENDSDIDMFWDMLAKQALGLNSYIPIDFNEMDYSTDSQRLAKILIAMLNNGFDITTKVSSEGSILDVIDNRNSAGHFSDSPVATEQVWVIMALLLADQEVDLDVWDALIAMQNSDGGFGYGSWSDIATTSWVLSVLEMGGVENDTCVEKAKAYIQSNLDNAKAINDSSSISAYISYLVLSKQDTGDLVEFLIDNAYRDSGFLWGADPNSFATSTCSQMLGELNNGSVYLNFKSFPGETTTDPAPSTEEGNVYNEETTYNESNETVTETRTEENISYNEYIYGASATIEDVLIEGSVIEISGFDKVLKIMVWGLLMGLVIMAANLMVRRSPTAVRVFAVLLLIISGFVLFRVVADMTFDTIKMEIPARAVQLEYNQLDLPGENETGTRSEETFEEVRTEQHQTQSESDVTSESDVAQVTLIVEGPDGIIFDEQCTIMEGDTVFDLTKRALIAEGLKYSGFGDFVYITEIAGIKEKDYGPMSGWIYTVNGDEAGVGCGQYKIEESDKIVWEYQTDN